MKNQLMMAGAVALASWVAAGAGMREVVTAAGPWEMAQATAPERWMPARVPGTVLGTLVDRGVVLDPFWGVNNRWEDKTIPDVSANRDFYTATYRTRVKIPAAFRGKTVWMRPEGINYRSEIYLNGHLAASTRGMFARNAVDVSDFVKTGAENELVVKVWPVDHPGTPKSKRWGAANGEWRNGGDGEIGRNVTMLMSVGWDFTFSDGVRDRNTGIWKDITFFATGDVRLDAPYVRTKLNADRSQAELTLELDLHNASFKMGLATKRGTVTAEVEGTDVRFEEKVELYRGERRTVFLKAPLKNPKLWWPRNYGPQNLYTLTARFTDEKGKVSDDVSVRFGVREATSDQSGRDGARQFYVNGKKVFIRGTNWIPDAMLAGDDARMEHALRLAYESGLNLVRLWGGGIAESDRFYEICDERGLLVWQEFWMTGDTRHPDEPGLYLDNVAQQVKRIRSHAALVHYVASNESTETAGTEALVKRLTGTTSWMQQSECDGVHDGSPYISVNPMRHYEDTASDRGSRICGFNPEYGAIGLPSAAMLRKFLPAADLWPMNVVTWKYREGGGFNGMTTTHHALVEAYGKSAAIEDYALKSQAADYLQERAIWESWNRARNTATGVLYWYDNPPIPELAVHAWDYDMNQTPMFFARRKALKPQHVQYEFLSNVVSVCSDLAEDAAVTVRAEVYDFDSRRVWEKTAGATCAAYASRDVFAIPASAFPTDRPHFIRVSMRQGGCETDASVYWRSTDPYRGPKTMTGPATAGFAALRDLPKTRLACERTATGVCVRNAGSALAFLVELAVRDEKGQPRAGMIYSDNYFILMPGETRAIAIEGLRPTDRVSAAGWNTTAFPADPGEIPLGPDDPARYWRTEELYRAPSCRPAPFPDSEAEGMKALLVAGKGPKDSAAEFFCYYAVPEGTKPAAGWPGVVLVHGGGGTAFPRYVRQWRDLGFAVIAPNWYNCRPAPGSTNAPPHKGEPPSLPLAGGKRQDHVANVANMVLAHSLIRSFPEVDANRTVFVGLSWGSWYGGCVAAVDGRFRGCIEIYCGDLWPDVRKDRQLVNGRFLHAARTPMWWIVSTNDRNAFPDSLNAAFAACGWWDGVTIVNRLPHSHVGFEFPAVHRMAKHYVGLAKRLPRLGTPHLEGGALVAKVLDAGNGIDRVKLGYTTDATMPVDKRLWKHADGERVGDTVRAVLPKGTVRCYLAAFEKGASPFGDLCGTTAFFTIRP